MNHNYTVYYHNVSNHDKYNLSPLDESSINIVTESQEEIDLLSRFMSIRTDEMEKENVACEIEKLLKERGVKYLVCRFKRT